MRRLKSGHVIVVLLLVMLLVPLSTTLAEDSHPQEENYLENPGFEGEYVAHDDVGSVKAAPNWEPWCVLEDDSRQADGYGRQAAFYWSSESSDPGGTKEGEFAQHWQHTYGQGACGVYQIVEVPENKTLRLAMWGKTDTCQPEKEGEACKQRNDAWMGAQIGVDPKGGDDFYADSVEFTEGIVGTSNEWQEFSLESNSCGSSEVTVFAMYHPDFPRQLNKMWVDNASLIVTGDADCEGGGGDDDDDGGDGGGGGGNVTVAFVTPQPPQSDGSVVHTVSKGETLSSIAVAYYNQGHTDTTVPRIKELNNLSSDIIYVGQKLTILPAGSVSGGSAPAPEESEEAEETTEEEAEESESAEEEPVEEEQPEEETTEETEVADAGSSGEVCMSLFDDSNGNTLRDPEELLLSGGTLTLSSNTGVLENYTTDGASEPHCFASLIPGEYIASATAPSGYEMTTVSSWSIQVDSGANLDLTFGASGSGEMPAEGEAGEEGEEDGDGGGGLFGNFGRVLIGLSGLLVLAVAGGLGAYFLVFRRAS